MSGPLEPPHGGGLYSVPTNNVLSINKENHHNFSSENYLFYNREKLQYIIWACFRNETVCKQ